MTCKININGGNNEIQKKYKMAIPKAQSSLACTCKVKGSDFSSPL